VYRPSAALHPLQQHPEVVMGWNRGIAEDLLKGAIAGAVATWVMGQATTWMYDRESDATKQRENEARGGRTAYESAAEQAASAAGVTLSDEQRNQAGTAIHWATGIGAGALYAVLRKQWPPAAAAKGLPFGAGFFLVLDELLNPLFGFTPGPQAFPWQTHARGLGGHLVFGATTELVLEGLDRAA
jgi:uncharacterized membrane protein YagU involved in acid resistance